MFGNTQLGLPTFSVPLKITERVEIDPVSHRELFMFSLLGANIRKSLCSVL